MRAHDLPAISGRFPKALGNDRVDALAKRAVADSNTPCSPPIPRMPMWSSSGTPLALGSRFSPRPSQRPGGTPTARQEPWLAFLYHPAILFDWPAAVAIFRRPFVVEGRFGRVVEPAVLK